MGHFPKTERKTPKRKVTSEWWEETHTLRRRCTQIPNLGNEDGQAGNQSWEGGVCWHWRQPRRGMIYSKEPLGEARALLLIWRHLYSMGILLQTTEALLSFRQLLEFCVLQKHCPGGPRCSEKLAGQYRERAIGPPWFSHLPIYQMTLLKVFNHHPKGRYQVRFFPQLHRVYVLWEVRIWIQMIWMHVCTQPHTPECLALGNYLAEPLFTHL